MPRKGGFIQTSHTPPAYRPVLNTIVITYTRAVSCVPNAVMSYTYPSLQWLVSLSLHLLMAILPLTLAILEFWSKSYVIQAISWRVME